VGVQRKSILAGSFGVLYSDFGDYRLSGAVLDRDEGE
jgi:hypothetical protein